MPKSKKNLTSRHANVISIVISAIYFICIFIIGMLIKPTGDFNTFYWLVCCIFGTAFIYYIFYFYVFKGDEKNKLKK